MDVAARLRNRVVVVAKQDAAVGVETNASRVILRVGADVRARDELHPLVRSPIDLIADAGQLVELAVGLPAVDQPDLELEPVGREQLHAHAVEEPRRVVRDVGRHVGPVFEVVVGEETDVGHEEAHVEVDAVHLLPVITGVGLAEVSVDGPQIELSALRRDVVARHHRRARSVLQHQAAAHRSDGDVAADAEERQLELVVARERRRAGDDVVDRVIERVGVVDVDVELRREILRRQQRLGLARLAVEPAEVAPGVRLTDGLVGQRRRRALFRAGRRHRRLRRRRQLGFDGAQLRFELADALVERRPRRRRRRRRCRCWCRRRRRCRRRLRARLHATKQSCETERDRSSHGSPFERDAVHLGDTVRDISGRLPF